MLLDRQNCLIKIIDFGISRKLKPGEKVMETYGTPEFVGNYNVSNPNTSKLNPNLFFFL